MSRFEIQQLQREVSDEHEVQPTVVILLVKDNEYVYWETTLPHQGEVERAAASYLESKEPNSVGFWTVKILRRLNGCYYVVGLLV